MKSLYHFFRLIRPLNLAVIALTMAVFQYYINGDLIISLYQIDFLLLVASTILVAAAGNIINDYFDIKADRVNKPEQLIIDVHIKRRVAILFNWLFNSLGILIAFYLSWKYENWWIVTISFFSINLLWFYSMYFKRTFVLGNVIVAMLTGIVPIYVFVFHLHTLVFFGAELIWIFAAYGFGLNLIREIIKDIADIKGDLLLKSRTLPIKLGIKSTKIILTVLFFIGMIPILGALYWINTYFLSFHFDGLLVLALLIGVILSMIGSLIFLLGNNTRKKYLISSNLLKIAMFLGLLIPLFL